MMNMIIDASHRTSLSLSPVAILTGSDDEEGRLVSTNGRLVAVLVRLSDKAHAELVGSWFLEAGFGPCSQVTAPVFKSLDEARSWIEDQLTCELVNPLAT